MCTSYVTYCLTKSIELFVGSVFKQCALQIVILTTKTASYMQQQQQRQQQQPQQQQLRTQHYCQRQQALTYQLCAKCLLTMSTSPCKRCQLQQQAIHIHTYINMHTNVYVYVIIDIYELITQPDEANSRQQAKRNVDKSKRALNTAIRLCCLSFP